MLLKTFVISHHRAYSVLYVLVMNELYAIYYSANFAMIWSSQSRRQHRH